MSFEVPTRNRTRSAPAVHTDDNDLLGSNAECAVCLLPARVLDGSDLPSWRFETLGSTGKVTPPLRPIAASGGGGVVSMPFGRFRRPFM